MSEVTIQKIFKYGWVEFNTTRKFYRYLEDDDVERILAETCDMLKLTLINRDFVPKMLEFKAFLAQNKP